MAISSHSPASDDVRPYPLHSSLSFSRFEPEAESKAPIHRGIGLEKNVENESNLEGKPETKAIQQGTYSKQDIKGDVFETQVSVENGRSPTRSGNTPISPMDEIPEGFDELPIELLSLTDRLVMNPSNISLLMASHQLHQISD